MNSKRSSKRYWYHTTTEYCPVCARQRVRRERRYGRKPKDANKRFSEDEVYDYCEKL